MIDDTVVCDLIFTEIMNESSLISFAIRSQLKLIQDEIELR